MSTATALPIAREESVEADEGYDDFSALVAGRVAKPAGLVFATDAPGESLWAAYLANMPADRRQHYTCNNCRRFIETFGPLAVLDPLDPAKKTSLLWQPEGVPGFFQPAVDAMRALVLKARVVSPFYSQEAAWGVASNVGKTGETWHHLSGKNPDVFKRPLTSAWQMMAEKKEDYGVLARGLAEYPIEVVEAAVTVLNGDVLCRSVKASGAAEWALALHKKLAPLRGVAREQVMWVAVATAPNGFCHMKNNVVHTLMDDLVAGLPMADVIKRWAVKLDPLAYQRPQAAPTAGAIDRAEKIVATLGLVPAFARRFAAIEDVPTFVWREPEPATAKTGGFFGDLRQPTAQVSDLALPPVRMTWIKFATTILPKDVQAVEVKPVAGRCYGMTVADDPDAPPLMKWDGLEGRPRNSASLYVRTFSEPSSWGLSYGWHRVTAITVAPWQWQAPEKFPNEAPLALFIVPGTKDSNYLHGGKALFMECLRPELREVRSVIEAHSNQGGILHPERATANGVYFSGGPSGPRTGNDFYVRVRTPAGTAQYILDRWD